MTSVSSALRSGSGPIFGHRMGGLFPPGGNYFDSAAELGFEKKPSRQIGLRHRSIGLAIGRAISGRSPAIRFIFAVVVTLATFGNAAAGLLTSPGSLGASPATIDFSQFSGGFVFGPGPVQVGSLVGQDIVWESSNSVFQGGALIGNSSYNLGSNGTWNSLRAGYTGLNASSGSMTLHFNSGPVAQVGVFLNYAPLAGSNVVISALAQDGSELESYDISILAPVDTPAGINAGGFRGIVRASADVFAFRVSNGGVLLDDLMITVFVPEPCSGLLLSWGLALAACGGNGVLDWRHRRRGRVWITN